MKARPREQTPMEMRVHRKLKALLSRSRRGSKRPPGCFLPTSFENLRDVRVKAFVELSPGLLTELDCFTMPNTWHRMSQKIKLHELSTTGLGLRGMGVKTYN